MSSENKTAMENFVESFLEMLLDDKECFFEDDELSDIKEIVADSYYSDQQITFKIANSQRLRYRLGSSELITNIVNSFPKAMKDEQGLSYYISDLSVLNAFEDNYFDRLSFINCLTLILELLRVSFLKYNVLKPE